MKIGAIRKMIGFVKRQEKPFMHASEVGLREILR
jgi:hypothetical protein